MDAGADGGPGWRGCHGRTLLGAAAYGKQQSVVLALLKTVTLNLASTATGPSTLRRQLSTYRYKTSVISHAATHDHPIWRVGSTSSVPLERALGHHHRV